jgi:hypothetical protein
MRSFREAMGRSAFDVVIAVVLVAMLALALTSTHDYVPPAGTGTSAGVLTKTLVKATGAGVLTIDRFAIGSGPSMSPAGTPTLIRLTQGQTASFSGWAIDDAKKSAAGGVLVQVDGSDRVAASYGGARPDVAAAMNMRDAAGSGFDVDIPAALLPEGRHTLSFLVLTSDGQRYYWYPDRVLVDVAPGRPTR